MAALIDTKVKAIRRGAGALGVGRHCAALPARRAAYTGE